MVKYNHKGNNPKHSEEENKMSDEKAKVVEKVQKLLAKANDKAVTEQEAQAFMLKAQELMAKYDVDVTMAREEVPTIYEMSVETFRNFNYRIPLAQIIAENFKCEIFLRGTTICFAGYKMDVEVAVQVFEYAYKIIAAFGTREYNKAKKAGKNTEGVFIAYGAGFCSGLRIAFKNQVQTQALVVIASPDVKNYVQHLCNPEIKGDDKKSVALRKEIEKARKKNQERANKQFDAKMNKISKHADVYHTGVKDGKEFANKDKTKLNSGK
jgi:hypothetical protein